MVTLLVASCHEGQKGNPVRNRATEAVVPQTLPAVRVLCCKAARARHSAWVVMMRQEALTLKVMTTSAAGSEVSLTVNVATPSEAGESFTSSGSTCR